MKCCHRKRKTIALLAANALDTDPAEKIRLHLQSCPGCRSYFEDVSHLTRKVENVASLPEAELSGSFHRDLARRIANQSKPSPFGGLAAMIRPWLATGRLLTATAVVALAIVVAYLMSSHRPAQSSPLITRHDPVAEKGAGPATFPTLAVYHRTTGSPEALDALLTRQAFGEGSAPESLAISSGQRAGLAD